MRIRKWMLLTVDFIVAAIAPYAALYARYDFQPAPEKIANILPYTAIALTAFAVCYLVFGLHRVSWRHFSAADLSRIVLTLGAAVVATVVMSVFLHVMDRVPRSVPPLQFGFAVIVLSSFRFAARLRAQRRQRFVAAPIPHTSDKRHYLLVGLNSNADAYLQLVEGLAPNAVRIEGILDERTHALGRKLRGTEVLGRPQAISDVLSALSVHCIEISRIVLAVPFASLSQQAQTALLEATKSGAIELDTFVDRLGLDKDNIHVLERHKLNEGSVQQAAQSVAEALDIAPMNEGYLRLKRVIDFTVAATLMVLLSPVFLVTALLVGTRIGFPIIFWQQRPGLYGRQFRLYKFRTMGPGHDRDGRLLTDAERLSPIGRFLRRSRLDELPQLYNILVGEMSFVGPRPLMAVFQPRNGQIRYTMRPGITGWAQIHGGDELTPDEKLALDIYYRKHTSTILDLRIILRTLRIALTGDKVDRAAIDQALAESGDLHKRVAEATDAVPVEDANPGWRPVREVDVRRAS